MALHPAQAPSRCRQSEYSYPLPFRVSPHVRNESALSLHQSLSNNKLVSNRPSGLPTARQSRSNPLIISLAGTQPSLPVIRKWMLLFHLLLLRSPLPKKSSAPRQTPEGHMTKAGLLLQKNSRLRLLFWQMKESPWQPLLLGMHC